MKLDTRVIVYIYIYNNVLLLVSLLMIKKNKEIKVKKNIKKIENQAKTGFLIKKRVLPFNRKINGKEKHEKERTE